MTIFRTSINIPVSGIFQKVAKAFGPIRYFGLATSLKLLFLNRNTRICVAAILFSALVGAVLPLLLGS